MTPIHFAPSFDSIIVIFALQLMILGNIQTIKEQNCIKKVFFFVLENKCFQGHESHQLSANIRLLALIFFHGKPMKLGQCTGEYHTTKRQSKNDT